MKIRLSLSFAVLLTLCLVGNASAGGSPAVKAPPTVIVEAAYPGASTQVVADTVAVPIEQQVNGVANSVHMISRCSNDGKYSLAVTFKPGTDLRAALVAVQNRASLSLPVLPQTVQNQGISIKKKAPLLMLVSLASPDGKYDALSLSNYCTVNLKDELLRLAVVSDVVGFGMEDLSLRAWLDRQKLAARNLTAVDVTQAIAQQKIQAAAGKIGEPPPPNQQFQLPIATVGRLTDPQEFADVIIKAGGGKSAPVRLKDLARIESGASLAAGFASFNGTRTLAIGIYPLEPATDAKEVSREVRARLDLLRTRLPQGLKLEVAFDFTANVDAPGRAGTPEYLLLDLSLPDGVSLKRQREALTHGEKLLRGMAGVQDVLALTENAFDLHGEQLPRILIRLAAADKRKIGRDVLIQNVRKKLEAPDLVVRVRDLSRPGSFPQFRYPLDLAISGPDPGKVRELAVKFGERLQKSPKLTDVWVSRAALPRPHLVLEIDGAKAAELGVSLDDLEQAIRVFYGSINVNKFGPTWRLAVDVKNGKNEDAFKLLQVPGKQKAMVPLGDIVTVRTAQAPPTIVRLDMKSVVQVTANPGPEVSVGQAHKLCEALFDEIRQESRLAAEYRLTWW